MGTLTEFTLTSFLRVTFHTCSVFSDIVIESVTVLHVLFLRPSDVRACVCVCVCVSEAPGERAGVTLSLMRSPGEGRWVNWEVLGKSQDELR